MNGKQYVGGSRKVFLSTVVAETGLTLPTLKYVIDSGLVCSTTYYPPVNATALTTAPASKSRITQRIGRIGRKFPGVYYPLFTKADFLKFPSQQLSEIITEDVSKIFLNVIALQIKNKKKQKEETNDKTSALFKLEDIDLIEIPTTEMLRLLMNKVIMLGFVVPMAQTRQNASGGASEKDISDDTPVGGFDGKLQEIAGYELSPLGEIAASLTISMESIRMIAAGYNWGVSILDLISVAAWVSADMDSVVRTIPIKWDVVYSQLNLIGGDSSPEALAYKIRLLVADQFIDGIFLFECIKYYLSVVDKDLCIDEFVKKMNDIGFADNYSIAKMISIREDICSQLVKVGFDITVNSGRSLAQVPLGQFCEQVIRIKHCIYDGYKLNTLIMDNFGDYRSDAGLAVKPPKLFAQTEEATARRLNGDAQVNVRPRLLLYNKLNMRDNKKLGIYQANAIRFSTMDGFVAV